MSSVSTIGQNTFLNAQILNIESQLDTLSNQVSSGSKSTTFSGINTVSQLSLQLTNEQTMANGYLTNINNAQTLINPTQTVLQQITNIANQVRSDALTASSDALPVTQDSTTLQAEAQAALTQISSLLNTTVGSTYLFGGRNSTTPPLPNFGSASSASSIVGQVSNLQTSTPLGNTASSGNQLYNAIQTFLRNGVTYTTPQGATAPSALGYAGETAEPGGSAYQFTTSAAVAQNATTVTLSQTADLPSVGQYIEFGTIPPQNAAYKVTAVAGQTLTLQRVPVGAGTVTNGVDFAISAGTSVNVITPSAVTTVQTSGSTTMTDTTAAAGVVGATSIQVSTISNYHVGDRITFGAGTQSYDITYVDPTTNTISFDQSGTGSGGLTAAVASGATVNIRQGTPPGSTTITVGSTTGVTAGMSVKFSNSSMVYTVTRVINGTQIQITQQGTTSGAGLVDPLPPPLAATGTPGTDTTATFGPAIPTQSVEVGNNQSLQYGIRADDPAFQTVLGALFALATTNLSTTTQAGYRQIATRAAADLQSGSQAVTTLASNLGITQDTLTTTQTNQQNFVTTLKTQLSNLDDVDMATAVSQLTQTQTQLQASFQLLSTMKNLTLANYL
jgi:flagellin-like hook-associated protein FlgL